MEDIVLLGAGGHCKVIIDVINSQNIYNIVGLVDKHTVEKNKFGFPLLGDESVLNDLFKKGVSNAFVCVGSINNNYLRYELFTMLKKIGYTIPVLIHKNSIVSDSAVLCEGTVVMAGAIINSGAIVGCNSIINTGSILEHDCILKNNVHICPGSTIAGNVTVSDNSIVGIGSCVIQGITIEENVTIGAGSVVVRNITKNKIAYGNPCKEVRFTDLNSKRC